jgi:tetratricopeptide (TPR) repeat protein
VRAQSQFQTIMSNARFWILEKIAVCSLISMLAFGARAAAETNLVATGVPANVSDNSMSNDTLRAYLQLQEQMHEAQLAIERTRRQSEEAAAKNAELMATQLREVEQTLTAQRAKETRFTVTVLSVFAGISFLAVVMTAYFQWRTVSRLADLTKELPVMRPQGTRPAVAALGFGEEENSVVASGPVEQSSLRLAGAIERLEKRILELEHASDPASHSTVNGGPSGQPQALLGAGSARSEADRLERAKLLVVQGQSLLNEDKAEQAVQCFDEALSLDPHNAEAMVKKGAAFERMRKLPEAIGCYDQAIALDGSMTIAYLYKGGLYNQMERFSEAVECYEQALRTQEKRSAA